MRNKFLGDRFDMCKRVVVSLLGHEGFSVLVFPLPSEKSGMDYALYERLLAVESSTRVQVMKKDGLNFWGNQRKEYIAWMQATALSLTIPEHKVIILDPDTGVRLNVPSNQFMLVSELQQLAMGKNEMILAVYHHKHAGKLSYEMLSDSLGGIGGVAWYDFGSAALFFLSSNRKLIGKLLDTLRRELNPNRAFSSL